MKHEIYNINPLYLKPFTVIPNTQLISLALCP